MQLFQQVSNNISFFGSIVDLKLKFKQTFITPVIEEKPISLIKAQ